MHACNIPFAKLTARTLSFQDLMRMNTVFVTVWLNGPWPEGVTKDMVYDRIPKPSEGGYCIENRH
jgi:hypothetical protein